MVEDISNTTLALLLSIAIFVSLVGILSIEYPFIFSPLTGMPTNNVTGTVSAEVLRVNSILAAGAINFGTGVVYQNNTGQVIVLNSTGYCPAANVSFSRQSCVGTDSADNTTHRFTITNDGNINVTVTMDINQTLANLGLGTGGDIGFLLGQEESVANLAGNITFGCTNETGQKNYSGVAGQTLFPNSTGFRDISTSNRGFPVSFFSVPGGQTGGEKQPVVICSKLQADDNYDSMNITIYINISKSVTTGAKNFLVNFTALDRFPTDG